MRASVRELLADTCAGREQPAPRSLRQSCQFAAVERDIPSSILAPFCLGSRRIDPTFDGT
eukprot:scaffold158378_cov27-Tisochrysis_lutea.AAC.3